MKVGDKVKVISEVYDSAPVGTIGKLVFYKPQDVYGCTVLTEENKSYGADLIFAESELELIED